MGSYFSKEKGVWQEYNVSKCPYRKENGTWVARDWSILDESKYEVTNIAITPKNEFRYVSLGDSIAVGHSIDDWWATDYGMGAQYGENGNTETTLIPGSYTDLIHKDLVAQIPNKTIITKSFAHSGDTVSDLISKLSHTNVRNAIAQADLVTICIGANDILTKVPQFLGEYIANGDFTNIENAIKPDLDRLAGNDAGSYRDLFDRLSAINPNAKFIFTNVYNPYKYLYLRPAVSQGDMGFFDPLFHDPETKPWWDSMYIDIDNMIEDGLMNGTELAYPTLEFSTSAPFVEIKWNEIDLAIDVAYLAKEAILNSDYVNAMFTKANNIAGKVDEWLGWLNSALATHVSNYQSKNSNFYMVDSKSFFECFGDKTIGNSSDVDYSDLVNVEFTYSYNITLMEWARLKQPNQSWPDFLGGLIWRYFNIHEAKQDYVIPIPDQIRTSASWVGVNLPENMVIEGWSRDVQDYYTWDPGGFIQELLTGADGATGILGSVIAPDIDPHPEDDGQALLKRSFVNGFGIIDYKDEANSNRQYASVVLHGQRPPKVIFPDTAQKTQEGVYIDQSLVSPFSPNSYTTFANHLENPTYNDLAEVRSGQGKIIKVRPRVLTTYIKWKDKT